MDWKIKSCKYCGKKPEIHSFGIRIDNEYWIQCENSACPERPFTASFDTQTKVIEIWNRICGKE